MLPPISWARNWQLCLMLRVLDLSGFVARNLSGCHIALGGRYAANTNATGDTEDEIRRSL